MDEEENPVKRLKTTHLSVETRCIVSEDGMKFHINPADFSQKSEYFSNLFKYETKPTIVLYLISGETLSVIVKFIGGEEVNISAKTTMDVLVAANYLLLPQLWQYTRLSLYKSLNVDNYLILLKDARKLECKDILDVIASYVACFFDVIVQTSNIGDWSYDFLTDTLSRDDLNILSEEVVWEAIEQWVEANSPTRNRHNLRLVQCIRLKNCRKSFILNILDQAIIRENNIHHSIDTVAASLNDFRIQFITSIQFSKNLKPRDFSQNVRLRIDLNFAGVDLKLKLKRDGKWSGKSLLVTSKTNFFPKMLLGCGNTIYMSDGRVFYAFDVMDQIWTCVSSPIKIEDEECKALLNIKGKVYAVWSKIQSFPKKSIMYIGLYRPEFNTWEKFTHEYELSYAVGISYNPPQAHQFVSDLTETGLSHPIHFSAAVAHGVIFTVMQQPPVACPTRQLMMKFFPAEKRWETCASIPFNVTYPFVQTRFQEYPLTLWSVTDTVETHLFCTGCDTTWEYKFSPEVWELFEDEHPKYDADSTSCDVAEDIMRKYLNELMDLDWMERAEKLEEQFRSEGI